MNLNLIDNFKFVVFQNYYNFDGRASRREYWLYVLASFLLGLVAGLIFSPFGKGGEILSGLLSLALLIPSIAVGVRRLRDSGLSGWNYLWVLLPFVGWIIFIVLMCRPSK